MALQEKEIKEILLTKELTETTQLKLVHAYIEERKKIIIPEIKKPASIVQSQLLQIAFNAATEYYTEKYFKR